MRKNKNKKNFTGLHALSGPPKSVKFSYAHELQNKWQIF